LNWQTLLGNDGQSLVARERQDRIESTSVKGRGVSPVLCRDLDRIAPIAVIRAKLKNAIEVAAAALAVTISF